jgi:hypothetical protein
MAIRGIVNRSTVAEIGRFGIITNSEHHNHRVRVVDDSVNTGGFLVYEWWDGSNGPNENHAIDNWVENLEGLESYFREWGVSVEWESVSP